MAGIGDADEKPLGSEGWLTHALPPIGWIAGLRRQYGRSAIWRRVAPAPNLAGSRDHSAPAFVVKDDRND